MNSRGALHRYATVTTVATFGLLIAGSLVTSTDSGLSVPDWPLSYGTWFPPMVGGIRYEHGHRMIAGGVGLMILLLAWGLRVTEPRRWVRRLGYAALGAVFGQALLGGLTVLLLLPPQVSIAHACLGQAVFCLAASLAWCTSPRWIAVPPRLPETAARLRARSILIASVAAFQLLLGAIIRHTTTTIVPHLMVATLLAALAIWMVVGAWRVRREAPDLFRHTSRLAGLLGVQLAIGLSVLAHRGSVLWRTAHVAVGALVLGQAVLLAWDAARRVSPPSTGDPSAVPVEVPG